jgi:hypothetical protein
MARTACGHTTCAGSGAPLSRNASPELRPRSLLSPPADLDQHHKEATPRRKCVGAIAAAGQAAGLTSRACAWAIRRDDLAFARKFSATHCVRQQGHGHFGTAARICDARRRRAGTCDPGAVSQAGSQSRTVRLGSPERPCFHEQSWPSSARGHLMAPKRASGPTRTVTARRHRAFALVIYPGAPAENQADWAVVGKYRAT